ncbi:hypothetical protein N9Y17_00300 [Gammaproteobacteria bacterium]|nr:hypothetical protein [Gammaproteobacteria bacterium]
MKQDKIPLVMALALSGIESGDFQISTLNEEAFHFPKNDFAVIDYIQHGGRVMFNYSELSNDKKKQLQTVLNKIKRDGVERFSTHDLKIKKTKGVVEKKLNFISAQIRNNSWGQDFTFNFGGDKGAKSGHALFVEGKDCFMVGFENTAASVKNATTGKHKISGGAQTTSWSDERKFDNTDYIQDQAKEGKKVPLKHNGMKVVLNDINIAAVLKHLLDGDNPKKEVGYNSDPKNKSDQSINPYNKPKLCNNNIILVGSQADQANIGTILKENEAKKKSKKSAKKKQSRFILVACLMLVSGMVPMMVFNPVFAAAMGYALGSFALSAMVFAARKTGVNWLKNAGSLSLIAEIMVGFVLMGIFPSDIWLIVGAIVISVILNIGLNSRYYDSFHKAINSLFLALAIGCLALPILILPVVTATYGLALGCMLGVLSFALIQFKVKKSSPLVKALVTSVSLSALLMGISGAMMPSILAQASALLGIAALPMAVQGLIFVAIFLTIFTGFYLVGCSCQTKTLNYLTQFNDTENHHELEKRLAKQINNNGNQISYSNDQVSQLCLKNHTFTCQF